MNARKKIAPAIVEAIDARSDAAEIYRQIWEEDLSVCFAAIREGHYDEAHRCYREMTERLEQTYVLLPV